MTVQELILELQQFDQDSEVRLAMQPAWPMEYTIDGVVSIHPEAEYDFEEEEGTGIVYLSEGSQVGYLSDEVRDELGW